MKIPRYSLSNFLSQQFIVLSLEVGPSLASPRISIEFIVRALESPLRSPRLPIKVRHQSIGIPFEIPSALHWIQSYRARINILVHCAQLSGDNTGINIPLRCTNLTIPAM